MLHVLTSDCGVPAGSSRCSFSPSPFLSPCQANNWASYDDWRRARDQWDYFYSRTCLNLKKKPPRRR